MVATGSLSVRRRADLRGRELVGVPRVRRLPPAERVWSLVELDAEGRRRHAGSAIARRSARVAADQAEQRYRTLVEQSPAAVYIDGLDDVASTLYISPRIEQMLGYSPDEWIADGELWPRLLHADDAADALAAVARHNETGEDFRMEYRLQAKDGRTVWIRDDGGDGHCGRRLLPVLTGRHAGRHRREAAEEQIAFLA